MTRDYAVKLCEAEWAVGQTDARDTSAWMSSYLGAVVTADGVCALAAGLIAVAGRFSNWAHVPREYLIYTAVLPLLWWTSVALARGYDARFIGVGSDEFRKVVNAGVALTATVAFVSFATKSDVGRGYVVIALPCMTLFDLLARYGLRKSLHRRRRRGACMLRVLAVGHTAGVADLISELRREKYHGLSVVGACLTEETLLAQIVGVPVRSDDGLTAAIAEFQVDTVAVVAGRELNGVRLRQLAWELEATGTDLYVAPALLDVAGPRTTIRPVAGLPLLHVHHPEFSGLRWVIKGLFDKLAAISAMFVLAPLLAGVALVIVFREGRPVLFRQARVGKDGRPFSVYKFRTMVVDAERKKTSLESQNDGKGLLFKVRNDPRVTRTGVWLRRWSLDELPQLFNVLKGDMSLVGPRPPLPDEVARYSNYVRRRLAVKPGITGLWQVSGRSDLPWEEAIRLDLRYVENWSFMLDIQILWKSWPAVFHGSGAY